uniref:Laminin subunit alpha-1 n=1 Tax=Periophthalmus magnuspinnatus TaxID=409849 RepID=A0A3B4ARG9_9GOBI
MNGIKAGSFRRARDRFQEKSLFPAILNLASNAEISANATCGDPQPEVYCKLVEHVPGRRIKNPHCPRCDSRSASHKERHPITNAIDGTNQWWQSPSIKNGRQFHWVTITLDLKQIFQVAYIIIKAANSPRPGNWILERSLDGVSFEPWQYYAISDSECLSRYNITPRLGPPTYKSDTEVICTSYYSRLNPLEHGEIHTSLINGRPGADDLTSALLDFTSARYIRLRLQRIRTLNADLMTLSTHDPRDIDPIVTRRYFYSIKDISIGGMCICYGHAQSCPLDAKLHCVCEHNTCGENCNECCPGYHQLPWQPGTITDGNTCEKCNCHNKAEDCFYNQTVSDLRLSLNTAGLRQGGGVCINCQQNTAGVNCETCADRFYRPQGVSPYSDSPCVPCDCDLRGSLSSVCVRDDSTPGSSPGQCPCREGFSGSRCERCAFGYRDFPLCSKCECNLAGSTNTDPCEECVCKKNVMGFNCDLCKPGFYNLQPENPHGCTDCFCFGVSDVCESSPWSTNQVRNVTESELESVISTQLTSFRGTLNYTLLYDVPLDNLDRSLPAHSDVIIQGNGRSLRLSRPHLVSLSPLSERAVSMVIGPHQFVDDIRGDHVTRDELLTVLSHVTTLRVRVLLNSSATGPIRLGLVSLDVADPVSVSGDKAVAVETCECPYGYSGTSCESCLPGFYRVGGVLFGGNCLQCECNDHSSVCDYHGLCLSCSHNTTGPHCEHCLPGFYGDATEGTEQDCKKCPCPLTAASNSFSPTCLLQSNGKVTCDRCQKGYTGNNCERCANGFYGNPQVLGGSCLLCECNGNVNWEEAGHCDHVTGECLLCTQNTAGRHCERCRDGYYGDAVHAKNCTGCGCDLFGAVSPVCDVSSGRCDCKANVEGRACDRCMSGFYGVESGQGCVPCSCSPSGAVSESCDSEGRCQCVEGVAGDKCDQCARGYYNYQDGRCTECNCAHTGGNCNAETGECICPPHAQGAKCEECKPDHWGHDPVTGCKPCSCSSSGSFISQCDLSSGQCRCREGFGGSSCDRCAPGYYGYPECAPCGCDPAGTEEEFCNGTTGVCDCLQNGECVCKSGVSGRRCEECVSGRFALSALNPEGCSQCYCSGLSQDCEEQGGFTTLSMASPSVLPVVSQSNLKGVVSGVFVQDGDVLLDMRHLETSGLFGPLYWKLPHLFTGNKLLSYGGTLSYSAVFYAEDGQGLTNQEPQVLMRGGTLRKLVIYTDMPAPSNGVRTRHDIRLTEHRWRYFNSVSEKAVTRSNFMMVLSNIQYVIIKASYGSRLQQSRISNITMETAVEEEAQITGGVARQIELCDCPWGYSGLSCQECAPGFFRQPVSELSPRNQRNLFVRPCVPCRCNNHSEMCDQETGACQDCDHHTSGHNCEMCASGYYGNVRGSVSDCSLCSCPLRGNSFSPTCEVTAATIGYVCTNCSSGYEGQHCERCSDGYYGNPTVMGGACERCGCSEWGALSSSCNKTSGQCECKAGVKGQRCDQCQERHVMEMGHSCNDDCTGVLLDDLDNLHFHLSSVNISTLLKAPYSQLVALENQTRTIQVGLKHCVIYLHPIFYRGKDLIISLFVLCVLMGVMCACVQEVELLGEQLSQSRSMLRKQVDGMVIGLKRTDALELVFKAESHAQTMHSHALSLQRQLQEAELRSERLLERVKPLSILGENLSRNLSEIRELIEQARRQAASIKVAVQADRSCVRSYRPQISSSNFNTLTLILKTSTKNNLLFYLGSHSQVDFMAVEEHAGKVSLLWDVGSGSKRLEFPGLDISNNKWTRINVTRFGSHASLSVYQLDSNTPPLPAVTATSPGTARVLDIDNTTRVYVGGVSQNMQVNIKKSHWFQGCLGEASLNEKNLGLWNYESREGQCGGCFSSPQMEGTAFQFDGSGYSVVQKSLRSTSTSIVLLFKTLSPGGLLLYLASNNTRDFLSMELMEGHVRLTFDLGSGVLVLMSQRKYNTGMWYKITLQRNKRKGYLSIMAAEQSSEKEILEVEAPGTASDLNRNDLDPIYIGGLPASRPIRRQVVSRSFVGCIMNVEIARTNFDLLRDAFGVRKGCALEAVQSVSLFGPGFVELAPRSFTQDTDILMTFSSRNQSGLLLSALSHDKQHFMSVQLMSGTLEAELGKVGGASQRAIIVGEFSDGQHHSVILSLSKKVLSIHVDELPVKSIHLSPGAVSSLSPSSLFIGGLPSGAESRLPTRIQSLSRSFRGCIQHLALNGMCYQNGGLTYFCVFFGFQCASETEPSYLTSGAQFGSTKHSHMTFSINPSSVKKSLSIRISFRTWAADGLLLLMSSKNQMDFAVLRLVGGHMVLSADLGKGPASVTSSRLVNDGNWHTVTAEVSRRSVSVSVGVASDSALIKGNQLDVESRVYVGGLPHTHTAKRINVSYTTRNSFPGCIRSVALNNAALDLNKPETQHHITSCFSSDQKGAHFNGTGYAVLVHNGYKVGSDLTVLLEFRTSQSDAVLLGISSAKVDAIGLELVSGQVVFHVNNGAGRVSVRSLGPFLCDGRWHSVTAMKTKHAMGLIIDHKHYNTPNPYPQSTSAETNNPVYVGGYPADVKQNCLSVSSSFRGCLRNVHLTKSHQSHFLDFSSAHLLRGVLPSSCPASNRQSQ